MTGRGNPGGRKTLLAPIHFIFKLLQQRSTVSIWLYEQLSFRIEGKIRVWSTSFPRLGRLLALEADLCVTDLGIR